MVETVFLFELETGWGLVVTPYQKIQNSETPELIFVICCKTECRFQPSAINNDFVQLSLLPD
jgi:hypothetical protein